MDNETHKYSELRYALINPPLTDPTVPYHSIPYLIGATTSEGFDDFLVMDANIEALNYLSQPDEVNKLLRWCATKREQLEAKETLNREEQITYRHVLKGIGLEPDSVSRAIEIFRDSRLFYHYPTYRQAVLVIKRWMSMLSAVGFPGEFDGSFQLNLDSLILNPARSADLADERYVERIVRPFSAYLNGPFLRVFTELNWDLIGLSVNYVSQLPFAIYMTKLIRRNQPNCIICLGGTEITDNVKYAETPDHVWKFLPNVDVIVAGEGETLLVEILDALAKNRHLPSGRPGLLLKDDLNVGDASPMISNVEDLSFLPTPRYDVWDWSQYWIPESVVLYSPTRGCYWNKCTFCDYGLNRNLPTSPSRERPVKQVMDDLDKISAIARTVYFAVDAISPSFLRRLAAALVNSELRIRWSAEVRIEKKLSTEMGCLLRKAGCVAVSFGYESGAQRVLDLINKGIDIENIPTVLKAFAQVGIGVQMMGFVGFPSETSEEASETFSFLNERRELWTIAGIGAFALTKDSIVARKHLEFGIPIVRSYSGEDIKRMLYWEDKLGNKHVWGEMMNSPTITKKMESVRRYSFDRPFVGGIDNAHTLLYFAKYGASLVPAELVDDVAQVDIIASVRCSTPFEQVEEFCDVESLENFHFRHKKTGCAATYKDTVDWLRETTLTTVNNSGKMVDLEIYPSGDFSVIPDELSKLNTSKQYEQLKEILLRGVGYT